MEQEQFVEMILKLKDRHESLQGKLDTILKHQDASIDIGDTTIEAGTDKHKGFIAGIILAKGWVGDFPIEITQKPEDEG